MIETDDAARVSRAATRVGLWVGVASALIITGGVGLLIAIIMLTSRFEHEGDAGERPGGGDGDHVVVDVDRVVPWVLVLGVVGVVLLALVAWLAARRSVRPLAAALATQRTFVSDASHELRTPLTALTSRIQILQRRHERSERLEDTIVDLRRNAAAMDDVLTDLLLVAEGEASGSGHTADVRACLDAAADSLRPLAKDRGVAIEVAVEGRPTALIPAVTLTRLCVALIDNATQHAPADTAVRIEAVAGEGETQIRVRDAGRGIGQDDLERIFERFARGAESGQRRGFGLGLALVRDVAIRAGGSISVESTSPSGTTFLLRLPSP